MKFHRDAMEAPTDPKERKALVEWLREHPLWTYPVKVKEPPEGQGLLVEMEGSRLFQYHTPGSDWVDVTIQMGSLHECLEIDPVYVNPLTKEIDEDDALNTEFGVWLEAGGWMDISKEENIPVPEKGWNNYNKWRACHDPDLDCGGPDLESALIELAIRVKFYYNEDGTEREDAPEWCLGTDCVDAGDGYCKVCGFEMEE